MERLLDVSTLEPCEPLQLSLAAARELQPGQYLRIRHRREPKLLFPLLKELGLSSECRQRSETLFEIYVWSPQDPAASAEVAQLMETPWP